MAADDVARLGGEKYVRLTTYRQNGHAVSNPMWVADLDGRLVMTTDADSAQVRRLRNDDRVELVECDMRGRVDSGARQVAGTAELLQGAAMADADAAVSRKYGLQAGLTEAWNWMQRTVMRRRSGRVGISVTPNEP